MKTRNMVFWAIPFLLLGGGCSGSGEGAGGASDDGAGDGQGGAGSNNNGTGNNNNGTGDGQDDSLGGVIVGIGDGSANGGSTAVPIRGDVPLFEGGGASQESKPLGGYGQCFCDPSDDNPTPNMPSAIAEFKVEQLNGVQALHTRLTLNPAYVDNTYGQGSIGWGKRGHRFSDLDRSDAAAMGFHDGEGNAKLIFHLDYLTSGGGGVPMSLGVAGGDGRMVTGDAASVLKFATSLSLNLNERGYSSYLTDSPLTDANYTPNAEAPNWDFRVIYDAWVNTAIFEDKGFGYLNFPYLHISPGKTGLDKVPLVPCTCPPSVQPPAGGGSNPPDDGSNPPDDGSDPSDPQTSCPGGAAACALDADGAHMCGEGFACQNGCCTPYEPPAEEPPQLLCPDGFNPCTTVADCPNSTYQCTGNCCILWIP